MLLYDDQRSKSLWNAEHHQSQISSSLVHDEYFLKFSLKSVHMFLTYFTNGPTNKHWLLNNLLGGGNYI